MKEKRKGGDTDEAVETFLWEGEDFEADVVPGGGGLEDLG